MMKAENNSPYKEVKSIKSTKNLLSTLESASPQQEEVQLRKKRICKKRVKGTESIESLRSSTSSRNSQGSKKKLSQDSKGAKDSKLTPTTRSTASSVNGDANSRQSCRPKRQPQRLYYGLVEDEQALKDALRASLVENFKKDSSFEDIEEMKVYHPTEAEFQEPILYIEKLYKEGANKI